jgi:hypothetical protein
LVWIEKSPLYVRRSDAGETTCKRRHAERCRVIGEVAGNLFGVGGDAASASNEMSQITLVSTLGVFRTCGSDEFENFGISAAQR